MEAREYLEFHGHRCRPEGGGRLRTTCPVHNESTPSFVWYPDGHGHCYGSCRWHGDLVDLVMAKEFPALLGHKPTPREWRDVFDRCRELGLPVDAARDPLPREIRASHDPTPEEALALTVAYEHYHDEMLSNQDARCYLNSRGLKNLVHLPVGYCPGTPAAFIRLKDRLLAELGPTWPELARRAQILIHGHELAARRIFVAERRGDRVVYFQTRRLDNCEPRYLNPEASLKRVLFGLETLDRDVPCGFITEGNFDALPIWDRGGAAVAITGSYVPELPLLIGRFARSGKLAVIASDWDPDPRKGDRVARELLAAFEMVGLPAVRLPRIEGCKDLGDWAKTYPLSSWLDLYVTCSLGATVQTSH